METVVKQRWIVYWLLASALLVLVVGDLLAQTEETAVPDTKDAHLVVDEAEPTDANESTTTIPQSSHTPLADHLAADDAYAIVGNAPQMQNVFGMRSDGDLIFVSSRGNGEVNGVEYRDEDILVYDPVTSAWQLFFDASDVGITADVNGFAFLLDGTLLLTLNFSDFVPGVGEVQNADVIRFIPTRWGEETNGRFEMLLDGSDVGFSSETEEIDSLHVLEDGRLLVSTRGRVRVGPAWNEFKAGDEDLLLFTPTQFGTETAGSWSIYRRGVSLGLPKSQDILALWQDSASGELYVTTDNTLFTIIGANGMRTEPLVYASTSLDTSIQANVYGANYSLAATNSSGFTDFDGLAILRGGADN